MYNVQDYSVLYNNASCSPSYMRELRGNHLHGRIILRRMNVLAHLSPRLCIEVPVLIQESERHVFMC